MKATLEHVITEATIISETYLTGGSNRCESG